MVDTGYNTPTGRIVVRGEPAFVKEKNVETVANVYPGRLLKRGTTDYDVAVNDGNSAVVGIAGYEQTREEYRKEAMATIYAVGDDIAVLCGGGFAAYLTLAAGFVAYEGDLAVPWGAGQVAPAQFINGMLAVRIPFTKNASEADTAVDIPTGMAVIDCVIQVTTAAGSSTIDVGNLSSETGGDADGFLDGESCATAGYVPHNNVDATAANNTLGVDLVEADIKSADGTPLYLSPFTHWLSDGTSISVSYTTSNHTVAGFIWLCCAAVGFAPIGKFGATIDASAAATGCYVEVSSV